MIIYSDRLIIRAYLYRNKPPMKSNKVINRILYAIGFILLVIIFWPSGQESETIINDQRTYEPTWKSPNNVELVEIGKIMVANNIKGCGEYHVKEITSKEYVVACTADGTNWTYYVVYSAINKIYLANDEMLSKLKPPY